MSYSTSLSVQTLEFLKQRYAVQYAIAPEYLRLSKTEDTFTGDLFLRLERDVWSQKMGTYRHKTPSTWWDHLKETHGPAWFLKRFPVEYTEVVLEATALFPGFTPPIQAGTPVYRMAVMPPLTFDA